MNLKKSSTVLMVSHKVKKSTKSYFLKAPSFIAGAFAILLIVATIFKKPNSLEDSKNLMAPPHSIKYFTFGYNEAMSDIFWIRAIQDFDYCNVQLSKQVCMHNSWLFKMLDVVTDLSPKFRIAYAAGGLALTVLITDIEGATRIFEKGVKEFPKDWPILYRAAYHYLYEVKDKKRAAELLTQAGQNGAPPWVYNLAGRLYSDEGELDLARKILQEMRETKQHESFIKRLEEKIASMEQEKALRK